MSQKHGKQFEDVLKALLYSGSSDTARSATSKIDIEAKFDEKLGLGTSVKASKACLGIGLADARGFWNENGPLRLIVACWRQHSPAIKEFYQAHEFILTAAVLKEIKGKISAAEVKDFHDAIALKNFPQGEHFDARKLAREFQKKLKTKRGAIRLNPKIDSQTQRRLQCSVPVAELVAACKAHKPYKGHPLHLLHTENLGDLPFPLKIKSNPRR